MLRIVLLVVLVPAFCAPIRADGDWVDCVRHGPFEIRSEFPLSTFPDLLDELEALRIDVYDTLQLRPAETPTRLHLFRDRRSYVKYVGQRVPESVDRRALYVKRNDVGEVYTYRNSQLAVDVRHECTHALLHNSLPFIPLWLDEGIAEYFETKRTMRAKPLRLVSSGWSARFGRRPSLASLEAKKTLNEMESRDYRDAWAWVHFLLHESDQTRNALIGYLACIQSGDPPGPLSDTLNRKVPAAASRLSRHLRKWRLP